MLPPSTRLCSLLPMWDIKSLETQQADARESTHDFLRSKARRFAQIPWLTSPDRTRC
ncbi:hypothetical protein NC653_012042 [Populus alba x Populus x berolinensis]|uniref:Uncharacterized protein n=1 Tax=Populus alba x Populus x berolinensis TaxID=444605 RepID=A0AAD6W7B8_9ROSI|nr:hypothetical protein NC653_012042 [Populus alba x Populus x berolinensis]